jgi:hypothetical protein
VNTVMNLWVPLVVLGLFIDPFSSSDYIGSNEKMTSELVRTWKRSWPTLRIIPPSV